MRDAGLQIKATSFNHAELGLNLAAGFVKDVSAEPGVSRMKSLSAVLLCASLVLSACAGTGVMTGGGGSKMAGDIGESQFKALDSVNTLRGAKGLQPVQLNAQLNAAAATHSRDMAVQNRPWHFGSDGSSPIDRVRRAGYSGKMLGELISETYQSELETLSDWMEDPETRLVIMDPQATDMGFAYFQEPGGKIWWTMVTGTSAIYPKTAAALAPIQ
jgi:hypothetical protein